MIHPLSMSIGFLGIRNLVKSVCIDDANGRLPIPDLRYTYPGMPVLDGYHWSMRSHRPVLLRFR